MFTVRHMTPEGNEALHEAIGVSFTPIEQASLAQSVGTAQHSLGTLWITGPDPSAPISEIIDGSVYVMNDTGATVAKYDLGGWRKEVEADSGTRRRAAANIVGSNLPKRETPEFFDSRYDNVVD